MGAKSQNSERPQAVSLLRDFLAQNKISLRVLPFKTWYDDSGKLVIEPSQIAADYVAEKPKDGPK